MERNHTITGQHYSDQLEEQLHPSIRSKRSGLLSKGIVLQHDNARAHTANVTSSTITKLGWEVLVHPPYSPDLAPSDYHLFGPLKDHLGGIKFDTDEDGKNAVQKWLHTMPETFFLQVFEHFQHGGKSALKSRVTMLKNRLSGICELRSVFFI